ncbi:MAG: hypothetical protein L6Q95_13000 [Planctomycetes bacterium]|nr:hypothetical protein [Planctomycetota bacterium]
MGNRASPRPPEPPPDPPKWQQVLAPKALEERDVPEPEQGLVVQVPEDRLHDPREEAPLFARLPEHAKEDLRDRWRAVEGVRGDQVLRRKETALRWVAEGAALLALVEALLHTPARLGLLLAAGVGAATGACAAVAKPGPLRYGFLFMAVYIVFGALLGSRHVAYYLFTSPLVLGLAGALATTHRLQRFDATEL